MLEGIVVPGRGTTTATRGFGGLGDGHYLPFYYKIGVGIR